MTSNDFNELPGAVEDMQAHQRGENRKLRVSFVGEPDPRQIREGMEMSQSVFSNLLGISLRTLQNWEQGHRRPSGLALQLLRVVAKHPEAVTDALSA